MNEEIIIIQFPGCEMSSKCSSVNNDEDEAKEFLDLVDELQFKENLLSFGSNKLSIRSSKLKWLKSLNFLTRNLCASCCKSSSDYFIRALEFHLWREWHVKHENAFKNCCSDSCRWLQSLANSVKSFFFSVSEIPKSSSINPPSHLITNIWKIHSL